MHTLLISPRSVGKSCSTCLQALEQLSAADNRLTDLPPECTGLTSLRSLSLCAPCLCPALCGERCRMSPARCSNKSFLLGGCECAHSMLCASTGMLLHRGPLALTAAIYKDWSATSDHARSARMQTRSPCLSCSGMATSWRRCLSRRSGCRRSRSCGWRTTRLATPGGCSPAMRSTTWRWGPSCAAWASTSGRSVAGQSPCLAAVANPRLVARCRTLVATWPWPPGTAQHLT
jgi:hypothetical protein